MIAGIQRHHPKQHNMEKLWCVSERLVLYESENDTMAQLSMLIIRKM